MEGVAEIYEDRDLKFTDGIVEATSSNYFEIQNSATVSDASDESYVDGYIHKIGDEVFIFPVGDTDTGVPDVDDDNSRYAPLKISAPSSSSTDFYCVYKNENPITFGTALESSLDHLSKEEYWLLEPVVGSPTVNVILSWSNPRSGDISNTSDLRVAHWNGSIWNDYGNDGTTGDNDEGTIKVRNISNFSPFTFASISNGTNVLPVEMLSFNAKADKNIVNINWETTTEINNNYFVVERSTNGTNFERIAKIKGNGNSTDVIDYYCSDKDPYNGISYYRLKIVDYNDNYEYSKTKAVSFNYEDKTKIELSIYPNPISINSILTIQLNKNTDNLEILVFDISGRIVDVYYTNENKKILLNTQNLAKGTYILNVICKQDKYTRKIIIE